MNPRWKTRKSDGGESSFSIRLGSENKARSAGDTDGLGLRGGCRALPLASVSSEEGPPLHSSLTRASPGVESTAEARFGVAGSSVLVGPRLFAKTTAWLEPLRCGGDLPVFVGVASWRG